MMMDNSDLKFAASILDALDCAKEASSLLPPLPPGIKPVYVRILNAFYKIRDDNGNACVSDISKASGILLPNATKLINELMKLGIVEKTASASDKRIVLIRTTSLGEQYIEKFVLRFHQELEKEFSRISENDCKTMIDTIQRVYLAMKKVYQNNTN